MNTSLEQLLGVGGIAATIVGLVVWVVKMSFKRQSEITDRYFAHLENTQQITAETNEKLSGAFRELSQGIKNLEQRSDQKIELLRELTEKVQNVKCKAQP